MMIEYRDFIVGIGLGAAIGSTRPIHHVGNWIADFAMRKAYGLSRKESMSKHKWAAQEIWYHQIIDSGFTKDKFLDAIAALLEETFPDQYRPYLRRLFWSRVMSYAAISVCVITLTCLVIFHG